MLQPRTTGQGERVPEPWRSAEPGSTAWARWWRRGLSADDRAALGIWATAHLALLVLAWAAAWVYRTGPTHAPLAGVFEHWDAVLLRNIAQYGYFSPHSLAHDIALFPGYPLALAAVHLIVRNWVLAELILSTIAGKFAVVALARLAGGRRAVLYLLTAPAAIFLMVGYSEGLFLALAIPAWHAATREPVVARRAPGGNLGARAPGRGVPDPGAGRDGAYRCPRVAPGERRQSLLRLHRPRRVRDLPEGAHRHLASLGRGETAGWDLYLVTPLQALKTTWWGAFERPWFCSRSGSPSPGWKPASYGCDTCT